MKRPPRPLWMLLTLLLVTTSGCDEEPDRRVENMARQTITQQAEQNRQTTAMSHEIAQAARDLVHAQQAARDEFLKLQEQFLTHVELVQARFDEQRDALEHERREIAAARYREPILAAVLLQAGAVLLAALPLILCIYLLKAATRESPEGELGELLTIQLASRESPLLVNGPPVHPSNPALAEPKRLDHHKDEADAAADDEQCNGKQTR